jgi:hypothetical protein
MKNREHKVFGGMARVYLTADFADYADFFWGHGSGFGTTENTEV